MEMGYYLLYVSFSSNGKSNIIHNNIHIIDMYGLFLKVFDFSCFWLKYLKHSSNLRGQIPFKMLIMGCCSKEIILLDKIQRDHWMAVEVWGFAHLAFVLEKAVKIKGWIWFALSKQKSVMIDIIDDQQGLRSKSIH